MMMCYQKNSIGSFLGIPGKGYSILDRSLVMGSP
jgi:hypothetical protein